MHLIHGFFCQEHTGFGTRYAAGEGIVATVESGFVPVMFAGTIFHPHGNTSAPLVGAMTDDFGVAELSDIVIGPNEFRFTKRYLRFGEQIARIQGIAYLFGPGPKNTWVGEYSLPIRDGDLIKGPARCILTPFDISLVEGDLRRFAEQGGFFGRRQKPSASSTGDEAGAPEFSFVSASSKAADEDDDNIPF